MLVEQAVFTSTQTDRAEGYQLVAASPGLTAQDRQELIVWGPSHDSLAYSGSQASSINFFPLPSGNFCISKTTTASGEYSGRAGARVYTQCLIATPDILRRFANNPFALLRAATAQGTLRPQEVAPTSLEAIRLVGRCAPVDHGLLTDLSHEPGIDWLAGALAQLISEPKMGLAVTAAQSSRLISGLFNCLPVECRTEISFTTGLRWSPRRPFRLVCLEPDPAEIRRLERQQGPVFSVAGQTLNSVTIDRGWAGFVADILRAGRTSTLTNYLAKTPISHRLADLDQWGETLRAEINADDGGSANAEEVAATASEPPLADAEAHFPRIADISWQEPASARQGKRASAVMEHPVRAPRLQGTSPDSFELLDLLDDAVFDAIDGKQGAIEQLRSVWPLAKQQVGDELLGESKEQYIKRALATWHQHHNYGRPGAEVPAANVLEVLCIVFGV